MLRRASAFILATLLCLSPATALAQQYRVVGPGGVIDFTTASVSINNTTNETTLYSYTIPLGWVATSTSTPLGNATATEGNMYTTGPLHLSCKGNLNTTGTPNVYIGANFGGANATVSLINGPLTGQDSISNVPIDFDVWLFPVATQTGGVTTYLRARVAYVARATVGVGVLNATESVFNASVLGTVSVRSAQTLSLLGRFGTANSLNQITVRSCALVVGN